MQWNRATYFVAQNKAYRELVKQRLTKIPNTKLEIIPCSESVLGKERERERERVRSIEKMSLLGEKRWMLMLTAMSGVIGYPAMKFINSDYLPELEARLRQNASYDSLVCFLFSLKSFYAHHFNLSFYLLGCWAFYHLICINSYMKFYLCV